MIYASLLLLNSDLMIRKQAHVPVASSINLLKRNLMVHLSSWSVHFTLFQSSSTHTNIASFLSLFYHSKIFIEQNIAEVPQNGLSNRVMYIDPVKLGSSPNSNYESSLTAPGL